MQICRICSALAHSAALARVLHDNRWKPQKYFICKVIRFEELLPNQLERKCSSTRDSDVDSDCDCESDANEFWQLSNEISRVMRPADINEQTRHGARISACWWSALLRPTWTRALFSIKSLISACKLSFNWSSADCDKLWWLLWLGSNCRGHAVLCNKPFAMCIEADT